MGCGIEGLFLRNRVRAEHADRTGSRTVRSVVAARHGGCTEAASSSSNATFKKSSAIAEHGAAGRRAVPQQQTVQPGVRGAVGERANGPVVGYLASQSGTGTKTDTPILTTPQSISVVTKDQIADQGAQNLVEALRYTPRRLA